MEARAVENQTLGLEYRKASGDVGLLGQAVRALNSRAMCHR